MAGCSILRAIAGTSSAAGPSGGSGFAQKLPFFQRGFISLQRIELTPEQDVVIARYLLIATLAAMLFSSSLTVGLEFVVYATFLLRPSLRVRFLAILREPTGIALVFFVAALLIGVLHGVASWPERMASFAGWRRVLLFFFAAAVFDDERAKRDVLSAFLIICALAVIASYLTFLTPASFFGKFRNEIIIHNHATQGVVFALAAVIAALALIWPTSVINTRFLKSRFLLAVLVVLFVANIAFVTPGRSGYLALLVFSASVPLVLPTLPKTGKLMAALTIFLCAGLVIGVSGKARDRIFRAIKEMGTVEQSPKLTAMGARVVFWKNSLAVINENPMLGVGTGSFEKAYARSSEEFLRMAIQGDKRSAQSIPQNICGARISGLSRVFAFYGHSARSKSLLTLS